MCIRDRLKTIVRNSGSANKAKCSASDSSKGRNKARHITRIAVSQQSEETRGASIVKPAVQAVGFHPACAGRFTLPGGGAGAIP